MTKADTAKAHGVSQAAVGDWASRNPDVKFEYTNPKMARKSRNTGSAYRMCANMGMTRRQAALSLDVTPEAISNWVRRNPDVKFKSERSQTEKTT